MEGWLQTEMVHSFIDRIIKEKEKLIKQRIELMVGLDINFEEEAQRTFPRITRKVSKGSESYYWNDGTVDGKLLISFHELPICIDHCNSADKITCGFKYE